MLVMVIVIRETDDELRGGTREAKQQATSRVIQELRLRL